MGSGLFSWTVSPLSTLITSHQSSTVGATPSSILLLVMTTVIVMVTTSPVTDARSLGGMSLLGRQQCNMQLCWDLFTMSQDFYQIHSNFDQPSQAPDQLQPSEGACISQRTYYLCLKAMQRNRSLDCHSDIGFRSAHSGSEKNMQQLNCSMEGPTFDPSMVPEGLGQVCTYDGPPTMRYCALFGDPHLRTFYDSLETCLIQGAWPLLDNRYLTVQVTSSTADTLYGPAGPATTITQVTVMIKQHPDCAAERYVTYQAEAATDLPKAFDDGSTHFGPDHSVQLRQPVSDQHVEIFLRYIDTRVVIRHYADFLAVSLTMPETILNQSVSYRGDEQTVVRPLELCSQGCPSNQHIPIHEYLARGVDTKQIGSSPYPLFTGEKNTVEGMKVVMPREDALFACRKLNLVGFYLDSCVFDLMNTGNGMFAKATADAMSDLLQLHPSQGKSLDNRTTLLLEYSPPLASAARTASNGRYSDGLLVFLVALSCALNACFVLVTV